MSIRIYAVSHEEQESIIQRVSPREFGFNVISVSVDVSSHARASVSNVLRELYLLSESVLLSSYETKTNQVSSMS